jgi:aspartate/methionine/tyrosine aminotransferase
LIALSDQYGFVIASDECYSELWFDQAPIGLLEVCAEIGRDDYKNCIVFHSLSKRSNLPGMRSGFVAGDAALLKPYLQYRTYHGAAMPVQHQLHRLQHGMMKHMWKKTVNNIVLNLIYSKANWSFITTTKTRCRILLLVKS